MPKSLVYSILWALSGDGKLKSRQELGKFIRGVTTVPLPSQADLPIIDFEVRFRVQIKHSLSPQFLFDISGV